MMVWVRKQGTAPSPRFYPSVIKTDSSVAPMGDFGMLGGGGLAR